MNEDSKVKFSGSLIFGICFIIGCMFIYWAVEYWVYNSFDSNRYELSKIQVGSNDSLSLWKLDKRTGGLEYCTKSYDKMDHFVCVHASTLEAKEYSEVPEAKTPVAATAPATASAPAATATPPATATAVAQAATPPATATAPATVGHSKSHHKHKTN